MSLNSVIMSTMKYNFQIDEKDINIILGALRIELNHYTEYIDDDEIDDNVKERVKKTEKLIKRLNKKLEK